MTFGQLFLTEAMARHGETGRQYTAGHGSVHRLWVGLWQLRAWLSPPLQDSGRWGAMPRLLDGHQLHFWYARFEGSHKAFHMALAWLLSSGQRTHWGDHRRDHCDTCRCLGEMHRHLQEISFGARQTLLRANSPCLVLLRRDGELRVLDSCENGCEHLVIVPWHTNNPAGGARTRHKTTHEPEDHGAEEKAFRHRHHYLH